MYKFLKGIMNYFNSKRIENYSLHRILNTDIFQEKLDGQETIYFGCGCFWGAEKCFWKLPGVITTSVGYAGGNMKNPTYSDVCGGYTGHAEVVKVVWNTNLIGLSDLLKMFWECHDPTQGNRQGNDLGSQYRSTIYYSNSDNSNLIISSREAYQKVLDETNYGVITTEIKEIDKYYIAESYHQQYLAVDGSRQYCSASPTNLPLKDFEGCDYKLNKNVWDNFNWSIDKCVLRSDNLPVA